MIFSTQCATVACPVSLAFRALFLLGIMPAGVLEAAQAADGTWIEKTNVQVQMPDGVHLATDVFLPAGGGRFPAVVARTPYDKRGKRWLAEGLVAEGYAVVLQDVRGMGASGGQFLPVVNERSDGLATLDWVVEQPWSDGRIGLWGTSYVAFCALVVMPDEHPALTTVVNMSGYGDATDFIYPGGAMHLMLALAWSLSSQIQGQGGIASSAWPGLFAQLPVSRIPSTIGISNDVFVPMVTAIDDPRLKQDASITGSFDLCRIPVLHITGWNDFVARETVRIYEGIRDASVRRGQPVVQRLVVGPWRHDQIFLADAAVGGTDYGPAARMGTERVLQLLIPWFDEHLRGESAERPDAGPVRLFVMGANEWRDFEAWPPRAAKTETWYLSSETGANSLAGDGQLARTAPKAEVWDSFLYDPHDPVPTTGGANFHFFPQKLGPTDQRDVEARDDVLVYTSPTLGAALDVIGPVQAVVYAASEGSSADMTAKLVVVEPSGFARIVADGIRRGPDQPEPNGAMQPGKAYRFTVDLGDTAIRVPLGHRLRIEISSSNFPKYTRNPSTKERAELAKELLAVGQRVHLGGPHPSYVELTVLPVERD